MVHLHTEVRVMLRRLGHWGSGADGALPNPASLAGWSWDVIEREDVEDYLSRGFVSRAYMGFAKCRLCGEQVGCLEFSDGIFCWPEGLRHYVAAHSVRLPREFIDHVRSMGAELMEAEVEDDWWIGAVVHQSE